MSVNAIGLSYQNQRLVPTATVGTEQERTGGVSEIHQLNAEMKQVESERKETAKEAQKAVGESVGGSSEKVQLLQNKIQMQQQTILMKQMQLKEIESPSKARQNGRQRAWSPGQGWNKMLPEKMHDASRTRCTAWKKRIGRKSSFLIARIIEYSPCVQRAN